MSRHELLLVILLCRYLLFVDRVQCTRSLSINNTKDKYGDIHDCVKLFHPLLKNYTMDIQNMSNAFHFKTGARKSSTIRKSFDTFLKADICPVGKIPIRRISIKDLTRERQIMEAEKTETTNRPNTYLAIARTKTGPRKYSGVGGYIKVDNPKAVGRQYSTTRIRLQAGPDSIEAGWRVDPSLYGDSRTRMFIRTDAGQTHCFNTLCPGFIQLYHGFNLDVPFEHISTPGGPLYDVRFYIIRDNRNGNWNFIMGEDFIFIGYWPSHIFTGLAGLADRVEWGAAVYSSPGMPLPPMGSGNHPIGNPLWDGTISELKVLNEKGQTVDASDLETYADNSKIYSVRDDGYHDKIWKHLIFYGGSGHQ